MKKPSTDEPLSLDHFGFVIDNEALLGEWYTCLVEAGISILGAPQDHSDGALKPRNQENET